MNFRWLCSIGIAISACLLPAAAQVIPGPPPSEDGVKVEATGRVQTVQSAGSFTIDAHGVLLRVTYTTRPGQRGVEVRTGDRVRVFGEMTGADRVASDLVQVLSRGGGAGGRQSAALTGTIRRINRDDKEIRIATGEGVVRVSWDEDTEFVRNTTRAGPREFSVGDAVRITGRRQGDDAMHAHRVVYGGKPGWTNGSVGEIVSVDGRAREIKADFDGEVWTVRLAGAQLRRREERLNVDDLRLGQDVRVTGTARGRLTVEATLVEVVRGAGRDGDRPLLPPKGN